MESSTSSRRLSDRTGRDWPDAIQGYGISSRILFAPPGTRLDFRHEAPYDAISGRTFKDVLSALCEMNILERRGDGSFVKRVEDIGSAGKALCLKEPGLRHPVQRLVDFYWETLPDGLNLSMEKDLTTFIAKQWHVSICKLDALKEKMPREITPHVVKTIVAFVSKHFPIREENRVPLFNELIYEIEGALESFEGETFKLDLVNEDGSQANLIGAARLWLRKYSIIGSGKYEKTACTLAGDVLTAVIGHTSNNDPMTMESRENRRRNFGGVV